MIVLSQENSENGELQIHAHGVLSMFGVKQVDKICHFNSSL